jgi:hypothetical protein
MGYRLGPARVDVVNADQHAASHFRVDPRMLAPEPTGTDHPRPYRHRIAVLA